jgi:hypothetical protein
MDWLGSRTALVVVLGIAGCTRSATVDDDDPSCRGDGECPDDLPVCAEAAGATCGDGRIDAPEECDGGAACSECRTTAPPSTWISGEGVTRLVPTDAGGALAVVGQYDDRTLRAYDADGAQVWSQPIAEQPRDLAADPVGNAYVVGSVGIERFGGQNIAANTLALRWRDDSSLVVGWTDAFDVGTANEVLVLAPW